MSPSSTHIKMFCYNYVINYASYLLSVCQLLAPSTCLEEFALWGRMCDMKTFRKCIPSLSDTLWRNCWICFKTIKQACFIRNCGFRKVLIFIALLSVGWCFIWFTVFVDVTFSLISTVLLFILWSITFVMSFSHLF